MHDLQPYPNPSRNLFWPKPQTEPCSLSHHSEDQRSFYTLKCPHDCDLQANLLQSKSYLFHYCIPALLRCQCGPSWPRSSWLLVSGSSAGPAGGSSCRWRTCWGCRRVTGTVLLLGTVCPSAAAGSLPVRPAQAPALRLHSRSPSPHPGPPRPESLRNAPAGPGEEGKAWWCWPSDSSQCKNITSCWLDSLKCLFYKCKVEVWHHVISYVGGLVIVTVLAWPGWEGFSSKTASLYKSGSLIHQAAIRLHFTSILLLCQRYLHQRFGKKKFNN